MKHISRGIAVAFFALFAPSIAFAGIYACNSSAECVYSSDHSLADCPQHAFVCFTGGANLATNGTDGKPYVTVDGKRMRVVPLSGETKRTLDANAKRRKAAESKR